MGGRLIHEVDLYTSKYGTLFGQEFSTTVAVLNQHVDIVVSWVSTSLMPLSFCKDCRRVLGIAFRLLEGMISIGRGIWKCNC